MNMSDFDQLDEKLKSHASTRDRTLSHTQSQGPDPEALESSSQGRRPHEGQLLLEKSCTLCGGRQHLTNACCFWNETQEYKEVMIEARRVCQNSCSNHIQEFEKTVQKSERANKGNVQEIQKLLGQLFED